MKMITLLKMQLLPKRLQRNMTTMTTTKGDYDDYDEYEEEEPIVRSEGRFLLSDVEACYEVYHLMSNNLVDNLDHRQDLEDYILEELAYEVNFMRFLGNHVGIYLSEYDYERYEREQNRNRDRAYDEE